jgi:hypothetical protein
MYNTKLGESYCTGNQNGVNIALLRINVHLQWKMKNIIQYLAYFRTAMRRSFLI